MGELFMRFFELRGELSKKEKLIIEIVGAICMFLIWHVVATREWVSPYILPLPLDVLDAFADLWTGGKLSKHAQFSLLLNFVGCLEAIIISLPLGFVLGLFPLFKAFSERYLSASRFLPLPALLGIFINVFGIYVNMKVQFLAVSIIVYLVPIVAQRVAETPQIYLDTVKTLGASKWQTIRWVFIPDVFSRVWTDIGVLSAISWTYITIVERINDEEGGLGALASLAARKSQTDEVYAALFSIMIIAFIWDKIHVFSDRKMFKFKQGGG